MHCKLLYVQLRNPRNKQSAKQINTSLVLNISIRYFLIVLNVCILYTYFIYSSDLVHKSSGGVLWYVVHSLAACIFHPVSCKMGPQAKNKL